MRRRHLYEGVNGKTRQVPFLKKRVSALGLLIGLQSIVSNYKKVEKVVMSFVILTERKEVQGKNPSSPYLLPSEALLR